MLFRYYVIEGVFSNLAIEKGLKERKEFLQHLGLARHEAYEVAKSTNFNVQWYLKISQDLLECGATPSQILNNIMNDINKRIPHTASNEIETPPPPPPPRIPNLRIEDNDCSTSKQICNRVSEFHGAQIETNGNCANETIRDNALFFRRNFHVKDNWPGTLKHIKEDALNSTPITKNRTEQNKIHPGCTSVIKKNFQ